MKLIFNKNTRDIDWTKLCNPVFGTHKTIKINPNKKGDYDAGRKKRGNGFRFTG